VTGLDNHLDLGVLRLIITVRKHFSLEDDARTEVTTLPG